ncbi:hypothetical protein EDD36DRAFT_311276 [Exophiala viscosa]|uniref:Uncharacterized protein n=1 Tax=Exophiala viscosa TaxID=2486360 RepID=A0AAN6DTH0_9EURO|nr:hypothetical protein EDD36DRAFT_311276 [Exophiala viscosa]
MAPAEFKGLLRPQKSQQTGQFALFSFFVKDLFTLQTLILFGSVVQILLISVLPFRVAVLPAAVLTFYAIASTALGTAFSPKDAYMRDVMVGRTSAQYPSRATARFGNQPAECPIVVFHFGVRFSHPLGLFSPGARQTLDHFNACNDLVFQQTDEYGMLGASPWRAAERGSGNTLMMVYYFRDVEGLNKFAHDDIHRKAWDFLSKGGYKHIGFFHEMFCVPAKAYESIYGNMHPLLMGLTSVKCTNEDGEEVWIQPVVDADVGPLRSQFGRMGTAVEKHT